MPLSQRMRWSEAVRPVAVTAAAAAWSFAFVGFFGTYITTFSEPLRLASGLVFALPVLVMGVAGLWRRPSVLGLALTLSVLAYLVVSLLGTDRTASLETVFLVASYAALFGASREWSPATREAIAIGVAAASTLWLLIHAAVWIGGEVAWLTTAGGMPPMAARSGGLWLSAKLLPVLLLLAAPYFALITRRALRNVLIGSAVGSGAVVLALSGARTAWAAIAAAVLLYAVLMYARSRRVAPVAWIGLGIGSAIAVAGVLAAGLGGMLGTLSGRTLIWETAIATIAEQPWVGTGPGTFSWARLAAAPDYLDRYAVYHAHNVVLQTLADGGVVLMAALAVAIVAYLVSLWNARQAVTAHGVLALASVIGFGLNLALDEITQIPAMTAMAVVSAAWALPRQPGVERASATGLARWVAPAAISLAVIIAMPHVLAASDARNAASAGRAAAIDGRWTDSARAYGEAIEAWPARAHYHLGLGLALAHLGDADGAEASYRRATELAPGDPRGWGGAAEFAPTTEERIALLDKATRLASSDPQFGYRLSMELLRAGRPDDASIAMARAVVLEPQLVGALAEGDGSHLPELQSVLDAIPVVLPTMGITPAATADLWNHLAVLPEAEAPTTNAAFIALTHLRSGDTAAAEAALGEARRMAPFDRTTYLVGTAIAQARCDRSEQERNRVLLSILPGGIGALYAIDVPVGDYRDHIYREMGLGDYQPPGSDGLPVRPAEWPSGLVPADSSPCGEPSP